MEYVSLSQVSGSVAVTVPTTLPTREFSGSVKDLVGRTGGRCGRVTLTVRTAVSKMSGFVESETLTVKE